MVSRRQGATPVRSRKRSSASNAVTGTTSRRRGAYPMTTPTICPAGSASSAAPGSPCQSAAGRVSKPGLTTRAVNVLDTALAGGSTSPDTVSGARAPPRSPACP
ncbi:hypothetical protein ACFQES_26755 [Nonomuraea salmonea]|uniref:hypothetical protein n=1 Tax=Nonomuraea salmonea TaxID=46181 RepID=UPI00360A0769